MQQKGLFITTIIAIVAASAIGVVIYMRQQSPLPNDIADKTNFVVMIPEGKGIEVSKSSMAVSTPQGSEDEVLNYTAKIDGVEVLIGQQPTPQQFIDIPQTYDKVVEQSKQYASFESSVGTVYLTRPQKQQIAMLNAKGTYTLAQASKDLTEEQWRRLFKSVALVD